MGGLTLKVEREANILPEVVNEYVCIVCIVCIMYVLYVLYIYCMCYVCM